MDEKKQFRRRMKQRLNQITVETHKVWSQCITEKLVDHPFYKDANTIGITVPMPSEVNTWSIIEHAWKAGKGVAVPKCIPSERKMNFHLFTSSSQLEEAYAGLYEPISHETERVDKNDIDLLVVPGLCFDERGYRLGFGGGYYDRFLEGYQNRTAALAFEIQVLTYIPTEQYDLAVETLITNKKVWMCR
ncbi:5-formyltetrahydrofolate cyclo-ligase [Bacillus tianshenii]|nr:5-formyltetrahydrofolate cyclo-ligase [Bacillus tianshenii]